MSESKIPYYNKIRRRVQHTIVATDENPARVKQEFLQDTDLNRVMGKYKGPLPSGYLDAKAQFGDFSQVPDFATMQEKVIAAHELFAALPATVRKIYGNDPGEFIAATQTPEGIKTLQALGLGKSSEDSLDPNSTALKDQPTLSQPSPSETPQENPATGAAPKNNPKTTKSLNN